MLGEWVPPSHILHVLTPMTGERLHSIVCILQPLLYKPPVYLETGRLHWLLKRTKSCLSISSHTVCTVICILQSSCFWIDPLLSSPSASLYCQPALSSLFYILLLTYLSHLAFLPPSHLCGKRYKGHQNKSYKMDCCLSSKDTHVLSCSEDGHVYYWDLVEVRRLGSRWFKNTF